MKILKYLFFLFLIVIIGGAVYFGTKDGNYDIASSKKIVAPTSLIFNQVNDYKNWQVWGPWMDRDPNIKMNFAENTIGEGASYSWESEIEGNGAMKTTNVFENDSIFQKITFKTPIGDSNSDVYWRFKPTEDGATEVTWGMKGEQSFMEKVFMAFGKEDFETTLRTMYDNGLNNINDVVQEEMKKYSINVEGIKDYGGGYYLFTTTASKTSELGEKMGPMLGKIAGFMAQNNIKQSGMPFTIYNEWDDLNGTTIFSPAIPVKEKIIITEGDVLCGFMEPHAAVKVVLTGNYDNLGEAHQKAVDFIKDNNLIRDPSKSMFEIYTNDPGNYPNPADWITEVYYPVFKDLRSGHPIIDGN